MTSHNPFILPDLSEYNNIDLSSADLNSIKIPYVHKNQTVFTYGVHNNVTYTKDEIARIYKNTNWKDKRVTSLYLDHRDDWTTDPRTGKKTMQVGANVRDYLGEMRNVRYKNGRIIADMYIVDYSTAVKLAFGAHFGISPSGHWRGDANNARDFVVRNFALVVNPAIKQNYCNNFAMMSKEEYNYMAMNQSNNNHERILDMSEIDVAELKEDIQGLIKPLSDQVASMKEDVDKLKEEAEKEQDKSKEMAGKEAKENKEDKEKKEDEDDKKKDMPDDMSTILDMIAESTELAKAYKEMKADGKSPSDIARELKSKEAQMKADEITQLKSRIAALEDSKGTEGEGEDGGDDGKDDAGKQDEGEEGKPKKPPVENNGGTGTTVDTQADNTASMSMRSANEGMGEYLTKMGGL